MKDPRKWQAGGSGRWASVATICCHKMATIQLETPARASPVGFQAGKNFLPQTQRRDLWSREGAFGCSQNGGLKVFVATKSIWRSRSLPSHPGGLQLHGDEKLEGILCKNTQEIAGLTPHPLLPRGCPDASRTGDIPRMPAEGAGASRGGACSAGSRPSPLQPGSCWASGWAGRTSPFPPLGPRCPWGSGPRALARDGSALLGSASG